MSESLKELSRLLKESKLRITEHNAKSKAETKIKEELEARLIAAMDAAGTTMVKNELGTFSRQSSIMPVAKDWEAIHQYVKENDAFHLLYKQILSATYREMIEAGEEIPGIDQYEKITISVTKPS